MHEDAATLPCYGSGSCMETRGARASSSGRVPLSLAVTAKVTGFPKPIPATLVDLSESGCRVTSKSILLINADIEFSIPLSPRISIATRGKITRCTPTESLGTLIYGIEFLPLSQNDARALQAFIAEESKRGNSESGATRVDTDFPVECLIAGQKDAISATAIDIGRGGMRIACERPLPEGSTATIRFTLSTDAPGKEIAIRGRILQRRQQFREFHHSVAFIDPDQTSIERIERFIRSLG